MTDGVLAIITWPDGKVLATKADFDTQGFGGCSREESQEYRATKYAKWEAFKALCNPAVTNSMDSYDIEKAVDAMIRKGGFKLMCVKISTGEKL
jgi:hypothetical protein